MLKQLMRVVDLVTSAEREQVMSKMLIIRAAKPSGSNRPLPRPISPPSRMR